MIKAYFDSSAYAKIFAQEPGSDDAGLLFRLAHDGRLQIYMSRWVINETIAAIDRKERRKEFRMDERNRILATIITHAIQFSEENRAVKFVPVTDEIVSRSKDIIMEYRIGADDSLHLYTAFAKDCQYFVCCDSKLIKNTAGMVADLQLLDITNHADVLRLTKLLD